jgi:RNA polymerase sigma-70 factor (ECF subfamily)
MSGENVEHELQQWLDEAMQGKEDSFCRLVEHYQNGVYNLCYRMLGNRHEAEDAAQESFWRAYRNLHRYDPSRSFQTWLLSIASHYCIDQQRKRRMTLIAIDEPFEETFSSNSPTPEHVYSSNEQSNQMEELINTLKPTDRAALVLRYWHQMSEKEIADTLSLSVSAVKSRLFRARKELAEKMETRREEFELHERETYEPQKI